MKHAFEMSSTNLPQGNPNGRWRKAISNELNRPVSHYLMSPRHHFESEVNDDTLAHFPVKYKESASKLKKFEVVNCVCDAKVF